MPGLNFVTDYAERVNNITGGDFSAVEVCNVFKYLRKVRGSRP
jgi:hypothetical protein